MKQELIVKQKNKLPEGWHVYKMENVCDLKTGGTPSKSHPEYFGGNIKWIVSGDVNKEFIYDVDGRITELGLKNSNARILTKDSVLIALNGQGKTRGTVAVLKTEAACNQSIVAFIPKKRDQLDYTFLFYYLKSGYQKLRNLTGDNERSGLSMRILRPLPVVVPPIDTQKKIVDKIEKQMAQIEMIKKEAERQKVVIESIFQSFLKNIFEKKEISAKWKRFKLGDNNISEIIMGQSPSSSSYNKLQKGLPFYQGKKDFGLISPAPTVWCSKPKKIAKKGDILISIRAPVGPTNIADADCCIGRGLASIRPKTNREFILFQLKYNVQKLQEKSNGSTFEAINKNELFDFEVILPDRLEQEKVIAILNQKEKEIENMKYQINNQLNAINQLPNSILNEVFGQYQIIS
ncbi:restriction endonuclease S subunit [Candidatus Methanoperedens nitroreducens]|uniref:Restriction endonuclease S subunit n=1 Tax=Candidatus Methanoperedens nitratireducens TaxID=1392998 RepID=A0A062UU75_9EURY|nr:restriction endonuclease subunit S [Candidatus Methanoperedens nitroreducens]KCZ70586.1 restriction endonuclease S subunit [Candidatus Methanoperedens nitroreducens]MDJ1420440.1 restriction endonuclease subunit S [Candidatus Methanoperedens sp.]